MTRVELAQETDLLESYSRPLDHKGGIPRINPGEEGTFAELFARGGFLNLGRFFINPTKELSKLPVRGLIRVFTGGSPERLRILKDWGAFVTPDVRFNKETSKWIQTDAINIYAINGTNSHDEPD